MDYTQVCLHCLLNCAGDAAVCVCVCVCGFFCDLVSGAVCIEMKNMRAFSKDHGFCFLVSREGEAVLRNCLQYNEAQEYFLKYLKYKHILSSNQKEKQTQ